MAGEGVGKITLGEERACTQISGSWGHANMTFIHQKHLLKAGW